MPALEQATFAAGCFWGIEKAYAEMPGVVDTKVGYTGGHTKNPGYEEVCTDTTGHAEAVLVTFDPEQISYEQLLARFWQIHDPTQLNRQGPDVGSQYRTAIFYHTPEQKALAEEAVVELSKRLEEQGLADCKIVTAIVDAETFYEAEAYHQRYWERHPIYCHF